MEKEVETEADLGDALKLVLTTGIASGWKTRNVYISERSSEKSDDPVSEDS